MGDQGYWFDPFATCGAAPMPERPDPVAQPVSLIVALDAMVPPSHPVRYVAAFGADLSAEDWGALGVQPASVRGAPRTAPPLLVRLWLSGFMLGIRSARGLEHGCRERFDLYWACGGEVPDHNTLWRFYQHHRLAMRHLLRATIRTAVELGLVELAVQAVDGSKIVANANPAVPLGADQLAELAAATEHAIADLEAQNVGEDPNPPDLPTALQEARILQQRVRQARASVETDHPKSLSRADPEARWMRTRTGLQLGYNAQLVVAATHPAVGGRPGRIILAAAVTTQANDEQLLAPMARLAATAVPDAEPVIVADAGYGSRASLAGAAAAGLRVVTPVVQGKAARGPYAQAQFAYDAATETFTCPAGMTLHRAEASGKTRGRPGRRYRGDPAVCRACAAFGVCTTSERDGRTLWVGEVLPIQRQHADGMATPHAQALSARRRGLIEPVFGILKERMGARRTQLRGRAQVEAEWVLTAAAFNLRTLAQAATPLAA